MVRVLYIVINLSLKPKVPSDLNKINKAQDGNLSTIDWKEDLIEKKSSKVQFRRLKKQEDVYLERRVEIKSENV